MLETRCLGVSTRPLKAFVPVVHKSTWSIPMKIVWLGEGGLLSL